MYVHLCRSIHLLAGSHFPYQHQHVKVAQVFLFGWVARFGGPSSLTSDQGGQFESSLWHHLMKLLGISLTRNTAYHPSANGLVERFHHQLKASLISKATVNWLEVLPLKENLHCTLAQLVYGTSCVFLVTSSKLPNPQEWWKTLTRCHI